MGMAWKKITEISTEHEVLKYHILIGFVAEKDKIVLKT